MKPHLLRFLFLLPVLVPATMKADIAFLGAQLNPVIGKENGSAYGFVNVDVESSSFSAYLFYGGLTGIIQQAGVFGPPNTFDNQVFGFNLNSGAQQGSLFVSGSLAPENIADLLAGNDYFNVYTFIVNDPLAYRGQIVPAPEPAAWSMLGLCIGVVAWKTRRRLTYRSSLER